MGKWQFFPIFYSPLFVVVYGENRITFASANESNQWRLLGCCVIYFMAQDAIFCVLPQSKMDMMEAVLEQLKQVMNTNTQTTKLEDEWLPSEQARKVLGVSPKTWQSYRDKRLLEFAQIGRKILVRKSSLEAFLAAHTISKKGGEE